MTTQTISDLRRAWIDAMWDELCSAHERDHMDASHDIDADLARQIAAGPRAFVDGLYLPDGTRRTWSDGPVDRRSRKSEEAAIVLMHAMDGAA